MAVTTDKPAPYAPPAAILDIVNRYRNRGLVFPVTKDVLARVGVSESLIPRTLQSLVALDLIKDDGNPTDMLEGIRLAPEAEYQSRLAAWLRAAYADVFSFVDPTNDDPTRIRDAFRAYQPLGQQDRMVTLFEGLCVAAGLIIKKPSEPRASSRPRVASAVGGTARAPSRQPQRAPARSSSNKPSWSSPSDGSLPPALSGLLESLPSAEEGWTQAEREKFYTTFGAVLDFCIPIIASKQTKENGGQA